MARTSNHSTASTNGTVKLGRVSLKPSISRVVNAIRRIGHSPEEAIMDIVDNSVANHATQIGVIFSGTSRLERIEIADNGTGMTLAALGNAMQLGSPGDYGADTLANLSKYGLGLKSAALSLGQRLTVITCAEGEKIVKAVLDSAIIEEENDYLIDFSEATTEEAKHFKDRTGGIGTLVIIDRIEPGSAPSLTSVQNKIRKTLGETYHRFMSKADPITFKVNGQPVVPFDPLFIGDENVTPLMNPQKIEVTDAEGNKHVLTIRATQLPHPPSFPNRKEIKDKYGITQKNTGIYVYRCNRIIKRATPLDIFVADTRNLAFRGSIDIGPDGDELVSLDVAKRRVVLPDHLRSKLEEKFGPALHMSSQTWRAAGDKAAKASKSNTPSVHQPASSQINAKDALLATGRKERTTPREKAEKASKNAKKLPRISLPPKDRGRVRDVDDLPDGLLWQPGYDENGQVYVQINRSHPFYLKVYRPGEDSEDRETREQTREQRELVEAVDYLLWGLAHAEFNIGYDDETKIAIMESIRRFTSQNLRMLLSE